MWDHNYEAAFPWGRFGSGGIRAWTPASETGLGPVTARLAPWAGIASGDHDPLDRTLGTFNALFPEGAYFREADLIGPHNLWGDRLPHEHDCNAPPLLSGRVLETGPARQLLTAELLCKK